MSPTNPFATRWVCPGALEYRFPDRVAPGQATWSLCDQLIRRGRGCIVGPHGTGKTTLLHSLRPALESRFDRVETVQLCVTGGLRLSGRSKHSGHCWQTIQGLAGQLRQPAAHSLLIVDGLEQLLPPHRWQLAWLARRSGLVILATSHIPLIAWPVLFRTTSDRQRVVAMTESLLQRTSPQIASVVRRRLANQDWNGDTNVRDLWFDCYDDVQDHLLEQSGNGPAATANPAR